jgi:hypothetical protein
MVKKLNNFKISFRLFLLFVYSLDVSYTFLTKVLVHVKDKGKGKGHPLRAMYWRIEEEKV